VGSYREFWEDSFERLDDYLDNLQPDEDSQQEKEER